MSENRKLLRLGTFADTLHGIRRTLALSDPNLRLIGTATRLALAGYLLNDHLVWLGDQGVLDLNTRKLQRRLVLEKSFTRKFWVSPNEPSGRSDQWWLVSIVFCLVRNAYDLAVAVRDHRRDAGSGRKGDDGGAAAAGRDRWVRFARDNRSVLLDAATNALDLWLPLSYLSYVSLPEWAVGAVGLASSLTAALPLLQPGLRVHPSM